MEIKKQGQILSLLLDERLIDHQVVVSWVDTVIHESENPESWLTEISLSTSDDTDRVVYLLWTHLGYEYSWDFTEYIALVSHQYQKHGRPLHNCLIHLYHVSRDFHSPGTHRDSMAFKEILSSLFHILDSSDYREETAAFIESEMETLVRQAQEGHQDAVRSLNGLIERHSHNPLSPFMGSHLNMMKLH